MWIFWVIINLLIPVSMLTFGWVFDKHPPKTINGGYGYRTSMSKKNQDTWDFAHHYCGKLWLKIGVVLTFATLIPMIFIIGKGQVALSTFTGFMITIQMTLLIISIFPTEVALRKKFDKEGHYRDQSPKEDV